MRRCGNSRCRRSISARAGSSRVADAEEDFELGVVLRGVGADGFVEARVAAVHRLEDGDGTGEAAPERRRAAHAATAQRPRDGQQVIGRRRQRGQRPARSQRNQATPQTTSEAPAQRSQLTCSFSRYLASTVSST